ncbi:MAG: DUF4835 family protein [Bacteroidetes bacterium]|nr:DUF4835 family protein [Bacteroidota bacterium]MBS1539162.1 DUF4835 family protein [Bacteroidota bacterium]
MRKLFFWIAISCATVGQAQELNCKVTINADQIQTSDRSVFKDMERSFAAFLNSRKWTNDVFKNYERINCTLFINISQMPSIGVFTANAQIVAARPVYNTNYESVLLNFADREFEFEYIESQPMEYNDNAYINNLTSMLAFYAYAMLAVDYDSFSEMGGTPFVQKMLQVVNNAQSSIHPGWIALSNNRSRYALMDNMNNPQMADLRKASYKYHRLALDSFDKNPDQGREQILDVLRTVKKVWNTFPTAVLIVAFFDTKSTELSNIFSDGNLNVRREAYDIVSQLDPKRSIYQKMISN